MMEKFNLKIKKLLVSFLVLSSLYCQISFAEKTLPLDHSNLEGTKKFDKKLDQALFQIQSHKSFEMNFTQNLYSALRDKIIQSDGRIKIKSPQSFLFEIQHPRSEIYVSNGIEFWKYVPDLKHAQYLNSKSLQLNYLSLLTNPEGLKTKYFISPWRPEEAKSKGEDLSSSAVEFYTPPAQSAETMTLKLIPRQDNSSKVLYAIIDVKKGELLELRIVQRNENRVRLQFSNHKDVLFDEKTFSFVPQKGIAVDKNE
jgi:outer membrane lipoprotein-sorting protein